MSYDDVLYDKAEFHTDGGEFPEGLDEFQAFVHTGMYLGWIIDRNLYSEEFASDAAEEIAAFRAATMSGPRIYEAWDGSLNGDMLSEEGNAFSQEYYDVDRGRYFKDYHDVLGRGLPSLYHVQDTRENYRKLKARLDERFEDWKRNGPKRFWQFWR